MQRKNIRNVAIIAHVDHGKTTPVDQPLRQFLQDMLGEILVYLPAPRNGLLPPRGRVPIEIVIASVPDKDTALR